MRNKIFFWSISFMDLFLFRLNLAKLKAFGLEHYYMVLYMQYMHL